MGRGAAGNGAAEVITQPATAHVDVIPGNCFGKNRVSHLRIGERRFGREVGMPGARLGIPLS